IKVSTKLKVKCFLIRYFSYTQNVVQHLSYSNFIWFCTSSQYLYFLPSFLHECFTVTAVYSACNLANLYCVFNSYPILSRPSGIILMKCVINSSAFFFGAKNGHSITTTAE